LGCKSGACGYSSAVCASACVYACARVCMCACAR
jgi:hypothetical protein